MAHSSPGQARELDSFDRFTAADSLSDPAKDFEYHHEDQAVSLQQQEPLDISQSSPKANDQKHHDLPTEETGGHRESHDSMLLEKPSSLLKQLDLGKGYAYGPAVQFAPGFFTSMPGKRAAKQAPICQEAQSHYLKDNLSSGSVRGASNLRPSFPSIGSEPTANVTSNNLPTASSPNRVQLLTASHSPTVNDHRNPDTREVGRGVPLTTRAPPFPDTSPKESTRLYTQDWATRVGNNHPRVPDKEEKSAQISAPARGLPSNAEADVSPPTARDHDHNTMPHFGSPSFNPQGRLTGEAGKERSQLHHSPVVPPAAVSRRFVEEPVDRARNHMVNRPVKEIAHVGVTKAIHRVRPVSRSSNVSKQRLASLHLMRHQILIVELVEMWISGFQSSHTAAESQH
jgi:hypothetical protein